MFDILIAIAVALIGTLAASSMVALALWLYLLHRDKGQMKP